MRSLYDQEYLDSGCALEFDEGFNFDTLVWTYATNFVLMAVCLLVAASIALSTRSYLMPGFFVFAALAFGIAGFIHSVLQRYDDPEYQYLVFATSVFYSISNSFLVMASLNPFTNNKAVLWSFPVVSTVAVIIYGLTVKDYLLAGVFQIVALLFMAITTAIQTFGSCLANNDAIKKAPTLAIIKMISGLTMVAGMLIQSILHSTCGRGGYEDCFKDCPLPNPQVFNHNALFHIVYLIGVMGLGWAEYRLPSYGDGSLSLNSEEHVENNNIEMAETT